MAEFPAGRINHHNAQITLLIFMLGATLDAFDPERASRAALAGGLAALSLAISIENLPFVMVMAAVVGVAWIVRGRDMARALAWFGGSLAAAALAAFLATIPPQRYAANVCDAFSGAHLIALVVGGIGFLVLAAATRRLPGTAARLLAAALAGALVLAAVALSFPDCLKDPHSAVDPLAREVWLGNVKQARPLSILLRAQPLVAIPIIAPLIFGLIFAGVATWREEGLSRARWLAVAAFMAIGVVGAFWEVRVAASAAPLAVFGGAWLFARALRWVSPRARALVVLPPLMMLPFVPLAWAVALPDTAAAEPPKYGDPQACFASSGFTPLDSLPPSLVFAPIDAGSYILAFTHHSAIGAPYHRNNHGNRLTLEVLLGDAAKAHDLLRASGARYLALCPAADELDIYTDRAPAGFAAALRDGSVPSWLQPVDVRGTPYKVYEIR
ncbi:MAG: hypothetical protein JOY94_11390 [Methylobacteriaceae bacterium]|nr:hypothetical protein [Methylobacteriaceae bacterium]